MGFIYLRGRQLRQDIERPFIISACRRGGGRVKKGGLVSRYIYFNSENGVGVKENFYEVWQDYGPKGMGVMQLLFSEKVFIRFS